MSNIASLDTIPDSVQEGYFRQFACKCMCNGCCHECEMTRWTVPLLTVSLIFLTPEMIGSRPEGFSVGPMHPMHGGSEESQVLMAMGRAFLNLDWSGGRDQGSTVREPGESSRGRTSGFSCCI